MTSKEEYYKALNVWKKKYDIAEYANAPIRPTYRTGESSIDYANRLMYYNKRTALWRTAPKPSDFNAYIPSYEKTQISLSSVLVFGAQHLRLFGFRLNTELGIIEDFFWKQGLIYSINENENLSKILTLDNNIVFTLPESKAVFNLSLLSKDGIHVSSVYFYCDKYHKDKLKPYTAYDDIYDMFMKDKRIKSKTIQKNKNGNIEIQDFIAPFEVIRIKDTTYSDNIYQDNNSQDITIHCMTTEDYKSSNKQYSLKNAWLAWGSVAIILLYLLGYGFLLSGHHESDYNKNECVDQETVYICTGPKAKSYHMDANCYGLQSCSANIEEISAEEAKDEGRKPCRYCCK